MKSKLQLRTILALMTLLLTGILLEWTQNNPVSDRAKGYKAGWNTRSSSLQLHQRWCAQSVRQSHPHADARVPQPDIASAAAELHGSKKRRRRAGKYSRQIEYL
jgi:hypothetical protein